MRAVGEFKQAEPRVNAGPDLLQRSLALGRDLFDRGFLTVEQAEVLMQRLHAGEAGGDLMALLRATEGLSEPLRLELDRLATLESRALSGHADSGPFPTPASTPGDSRPSTPILPVPSSPDATSRSGERSSGPSSRSRSGVVALPAQVGPWRILGPLGEAEGAIRREALPGLVEAFVPGAVDVHHKNGDGI